MESFRVNKLKMKNRSQHELVYNVKRGAYEASEKNISVYMQRKQRKIVTFVEPI